jgi:hypothetical protein
MLAANVVSSGFFAMAKVEQLQDPAPKTGRPRGSKTRVSAEVAAEMLVQAAGPGVARVVLDRVLDKVLSRAAVPGGLPTPRIVGR